jgi:hypothetical protein
MDDVTSYDTKLPPKNGSSARAGSEPGDVTLLHPIQSKETITTDPF